jgi:hypothetical protein
VAALSPDKYVALIAMIGICQWVRIFFALDGPSLDTVAVQLPLSLLVLFKNLLSILFEVLSDVPLEYHRATTYATPFLLLLSLAALIGLPLDKTLSDSVLDFFRKEEKDGSLFCEGLKGAIVEYLWVLELLPDTPGEGPECLIVIEQVLKRVRLVTV